MGKQWLITAWLLCGAAASVADEPQELNMPRTLVPLPVKEGDAPPELRPPPRSMFAKEPFPVASMEEEIRKLKAAREELEFSQRNLPPAPRTEAKGIDHDELLLKLRLGDVLHRLQQKGPRHVEHPSAEKTPAEKTHGEKLHVRTTEKPHAPAHPESTKDPAKEAKPLDSSEGHAVKTGGPKEHPIDALALAHSLFLAGQPNEALQAFRKLDLKEFRPEDRMPIQYLIASCLRQMGRTDEAIGVYRELANARGDEEIAAVSQWQLAQLRWRKEMNDLLLTIRNRRQSLEKTR